MAIIINSQPDTISPVFADNKFVIKETGAAYFTLTFSGDVSGTFKIYPNTSEIATFDARYHLENYIYSQIALPSQSVLPDGIKSYNLNIVSNIGNEVNILNRYFFNAALQDNEVNNFSEGIILNNISSEINVHRNDELTIQKLFKDDILNYDISPNGVGVSAATTSYISEGVKVNIIEEDKRYTPYRFAYVNNWGGTDYVNFSLADREKLKISKDYLTNDNKEILYNVDVDQEFTVYSDSMTEQESKKLKYFWISPLIHLIKDGVHYPVNIIAKSVKVLRERESGLISYSVKFRYQSNFNVQK